MPTAYSTPGVYVEWLDTSPVRIELGRTDVAGFVGIAERGPVQTPVKIESYRQFFTTFGDRMPDGYLAYAVSGFFENGGRTCWVVRAADPAQALPARARLQLPDRAPIDLEAASEGTWGNAIEIEAVWGRDRVIQLIARTPDEREQRLDPDLLLAPPDPQPSRTYTNLLGVTDDQLPDRDPEQLVRAVTYEVAPVRVINADARRATLEGGRDGLSTLMTGHLVGDPDAESTWGVAALERIDDVSMVAVPDLMAGQIATSRGASFAGFGKDEVQDAQIAIINSCLQRRDRVAILDMPPVNRREVLERQKRWPQTSVAAVYHPWIVVDDPLRLTANVRHIPPSGYVAGMIARVDRRRGVHKPPANETLEGVFDVREVLDDQAHAALNDKLVNAIRPVPGRGVLVLGVRTLDPDIRWRYLNVRRLFTAVEETLDEQMQWVTFEPNSPRLWRDIDRAVRGLLERMYRAGMLDGATSDDAYLVRCDASTNPEWDTDEGRVTCVIGLQPPYPAEFVVVRIGVTRSGIQIEEKGAQDV
jgi:phage tail sheath protein FI